MNLDFQTKSWLSELGLDGNLALYQLPAEELVAMALKNGEGCLTDSGALAIDTGKFTGRSPKDRFIVEDALTKDTVFWGEVNHKFEAAKFNLLLGKMLTHLKGKPFYLKKGYACAKVDYQLPINLISEKAYSSLFAHHLFLRYAQDPVPRYEQSDWTVIALPSFLADPKQDGTRSENFSILNFSRRMILIGGTGYTGEIKKGIFSVLNFLLPQYHEVLPMHCSANVGNSGDTAIFFGLSGTGKTTLSADPNRRLVGDDEHGWDAHSVFNFEGGCYAKVIDLSADKEPQIFGAIREFALLENVGFHPGSDQVNYSDSSKTENTRVAYPLDYITGALQPSIAEAPKNIFFLTCDAFGVLPPISLLDSNQAKFHFLTGYTAKVAGTETGVTEPQLTFSACFGKAFLPLHPLRYAELLAAKLKTSGAKVWLVNTGWTGGGYGSGTRMKLTHTRALISAALSGELEQVEFVKEKIFNLSIPLSAEGVSPEILNPRDNWKNKELYDLKAAELKSALDRNFKQYKDYVRN